MADGDIKEKHYDTPCQVVVARDPIRLCGAVVRCKHARFEEKHPKPHGVETELYLGRNVRGATLEGTGTPTLQVGINGYNFDMTMGEKNTVPKEVYHVLLDSQSRTRVPDVEKAERAPRPSGTGGYSKLETLCDYEVALIKEGK